MPPEPEETAAPPLGVASEWQDNERVRAMLFELERRQFEALKLYRPMPVQQAFHRSRSRQKIVRGSNRSGKSTASMIELAWALTGTHPDRQRYPLRDGRALVVARDMEKIGEVVWRKLGRAGSFRMVRDEITGQWRAKTPADKGEGKYSPPLVPPRLIKDITWESKKSNIPKRLVMKNGWECGFFSSKADPEAIAGVDVDIVVFDEEVLNERWLPEALARLIDRNGWFWWGATPNLGTAQLFELHQRAEALAEAEEEAEEPSAEPPLVAEFFLSIWDNVHMDDKSKRDFEESLSDSERLLRIDGVFAIAGTRVFEASFFPRGIHGCEPFPVPPGWSRFLAIDPGFKVGAVLFATIPPPKPDDSGLDPELFGDYVYFYDEIYIRSCDAAQLAGALKAHMGDQLFQAHLFDSHGGNLREIGSGKTPEQQYRDAFKKAKVKMPLCGTMLTYGYDDVAGRILRVKDWLRVRPDGTAKLRFIRSAVPMTVRNMERYSWRVTNGEVTDKPAPHDSHQCDNVGYLCMYSGLKYRKPISVAANKDGSYDAWLRLKREEKRLARRDGKEQTGVTLA